MKKILISRKEENNVNVEFEVKLEFINRAEKILKSNIKTPYKISVIDLISNINNDNKYYTKNSDNSETVVLVVSDYVTSKPNDSEKDNIDSLPIYK